MMDEQTLAWSRRIKLLAIIGLPLLWACILFLFMNITSPLQSGPLSVLTVFVLVYLLIASTLYAGMILIYKVASIFGWRGLLRRKQLYYLVSVVALGPVFILALNTLGQLDIKEFILVALLIVIGCFYVLRRSRKEAL